MSGEREEVVPTTLVVRSAGVVAAAVVSKQRGTRAPEPTTLRGFIHPANCTACKKDRCYREMQEQEHTGLKSTLSAG